MDADTRQRMLDNAALRVLNAERMFCEITCVNLSTFTIFVCKILSNLCFTGRAVQGGANIARHKLLVRLVGRLQMQSFEPHLRSHIIGEQKTRADLALLWLTEMFSLHQVC
jgi:hypothetical protein